MYGDPHCGGGGIGGAGGSGGPGGFGLKPTNGCKTVKVQSRPGVILQALHLRSAQLSQDGPTGWLETAVMTPTGVVRLASSAKRMCGRSLVEYVVLVPSVKSTVPLKGCCDELDVNCQLIPSRLQPWPL